MAKSEKLTALVVDRAHKRAEPVVLNDGQGLYFRKQTAEGASWTLRYKIVGKARWMALGNYPDMSLAEARKKARKERLHLDNQRDPLEVRRDEKRKTAARGSFQELAEDWFATEIEGHIQHTHVPRRHLDKYLLPKLRTLRADEVTTADITRILDAIKKEKPTVANDLIRFARRIFDFGLRRHRVTMNPAGGLVPKRDGGGTERPRKRALRRDELAKLMGSANASDAFGRANALAMKLLLALLVRKRELIGAKKKSFDLDGVTDQGPVWRLTGSRTKNRELIDIPLVPQVVEWLREAMAIAGDSEYLFPKRRQDRRSRFPHMGIDTLNAALANLEHGLEHFTVHDLRRSARTHLGALGVRREVAERCLNHALKGVEGTYDTHPYFDERREVLGKWTGLLCVLDETDADTRKTRSSEAEE